jgi:hypothetical protein
LLGVNLNSPYEAAKRLMRECEALRSTSDRFKEYLKRLEIHDLEAEKVIMGNYEKEFQKVESVAQTLIQMIIDYKEKL